MIMNITDKIWASNNKIILPVSLVNDNIGPLDFLEEFSLLSDDLIIGEEDVESELPTRVLQLVLPDDLPGLRGAGVADGVEVRRPGGELLLPGSHGRERHHHQHWTLERVHVEEILEEGDGLDGLTETLR